MEIHKGDLCVSKLLITLTNKRKNHPVKGENQGQYTVVAVTAMTS